MLFPGTVVCRGCRIPSTLLWDCATNDLKTNLGVSFAKSSAGELAYLWRRPDHMARLGTLITSVTQRGNGYASLARQLRVPGVWINLGRVCEKRAATMAYRCADGPQCASWAAASEEEALSLIAVELSDVQLFPTKGRVRAEFVEGRRPATTKQTRKQTQALPSKVSIRHPCSASTQCSASPISPAANAGGSAQTVRPQCGQPRSPKLETNSCTRSGTPRGRP